MPLGCCNGAEYGAQQTICDMGELIENEGVTLGDTTKLSCVITEYFSKTATHFRHELVCFLKTNMDLDQHDKLAKYEPDS